MLAHTSLRLRKDCPKMEVSLNYKHTNSWDCRPVRNTALGTWFRGPLPPRMTGGMTSNTLQPILHLKRLRLWTAWCQRTPWVPVRSGQVWKPRTGTSFVPRTERAPDLAPWRTLWVGTGTPQNGNRAGDGDRSSVNSS